MADKSASGDSHHQFLRRALSFTLWENLFKPVSPLLELTCAALFVGGAWGRFKFYESLVFLVFRVSVMGVDKGVIWYYSQVEEKAYLKAFFRSLSGCFFAFGVMGLLTLGSYYGWLPFSEWILGKNARGVHISGSELLLYLMAVPMMLISELCIQANVNKRNLKYRILVPGIAVPLVTYGSALGGRFFAPDIFTFPLCLLTGNSVGALLAIWGFFRVHRPAWRDISLVPLPPWKMIRYSFPLASANIFSALAARADIFMLAGFIGVRSVEVYTVVCMVGRSLTSIRQSFENILLSAFSSSGTGRLTAKVKHYYNYSIWLVMSIQGVLLALIVLFGREGLGLINSQYAAGYWAMIFTAFFVYANTITDFSGLLALGLGRTAIVPLSHVIFFGVNVGLNFLWIPRWDTLGAALALGVANMTGGAIYFAYLAFHHKNLLLLREYWLSIAAEALVLGLPVAGGLYWKLTPLANGACLFLSVGAVFWMQKTWYRRFNSLISGSLSQPAP